MVKNPSEHYFFLNHISPASRPFPLLLFSLAHSLYSALSLVTSASMALITCLPEGFWVLIFELDLSGLPADAWRLLDMGSEMSHRNFETNSWPAHAITNPAINSNICVCVYLREHQDIYIYLSQGTASGAILLSLTSHHTQHVSKSQNSTS